MQKHLSYKNYFKMILNKDQHILFGSKQIWCMVYIKVLVVR